MGHVKGIGGLFFRARDPDALNAWYRERLGIGAGCNADDTGPVNEWVWNVTAGPVVFSAFKAETDYFAADRQFMINLRVDDLDGMIVALEAKGISILGRQDEDYGNFAWILDCDGVKLELWQQKGPAPS